MLKVGLTGGMACGKSFVAAELGRLGCHIIEADEVGHQVLEPGGEAYDAVVAAFGAGILDEQRRIDRTRLAELAFRGAAEIEKLNAIVHPAVRARAQHEFQRLGERDPHGVVIYVAAILIESGAYQEVDKIIVVGCDRAQQLARALHRSDATEASVLARLERQMPVEKKKEFADFVIDTSGTKEETLRQTEIVYRELRRLSAQAGGSVVR